jgi:hypothetical protein
MSSLICFLLFSNADCPGKTLKDSSGMRLLQPIQGYQ